MSGSVGSAIALSEIRVLRADDLLDLTFSFHNLQLAQGSSGAMLVRAGPAADAFVIVTFAPQHLAEGVVEAAAAAPPPPVGAALADPSRLVFRLPQGVNELPLTLDGLLGWQHLVPSLAPNAKRAQPFPAELLDHSPPAEPAPTETALEMPWRLILSPGPGGGWAHATAAVTHNGQTELWHTRLATRQVGGTAPSEVETAGRTVRAIWSPDLLVSNEPAQRISLRAADRRDFVRLSSDFEPTEANRNPRPVAITVNRLMLSALGCWLDLTGAWDVPHDNSGIQDFSIQVETGIWRRIDHLEREAELGQDPDQAMQFVIDEVLTDATTEDIVAVYELAHQRPDIDAALIAVKGSDQLPVTRHLDTFEWQHRAAQGRDTYVRVSRPGYLFPLGHRAVLADVTERGIEPAPDGSPTGYLRGHTFIVVKEPFRDYRPLVSAYAHGGRECPFVSARILNTTTPDLKMPADEHDVFWPQTDEGDFAWSVVLEDQEGHFVDVSMPLLFVPTVDSRGYRFDEAKAQTEYLTSSKRTVSTGGQHVCYAPSRPGKSGEGVLATQSMVMTASVGNELGGLPPDHPRFLPSLESAQVRVPSVDALLGAAVPTSAVSISMDPAYLQAGFDVAANKAELFVKTAGVLHLAFPAERSGGVARPNAMVGALSRVLGPVGDPDNIVNGVVDVAKLVPDAKLLGGLSLKDLILKTTVPFTTQELPDFAGMTPDEVWDRLTSAAAPSIRMPSFVSRTVRDAQGVPLAVETQYVWTPALSKPENAPELDFFKPDPGARLVLVTTLRAALDGSPPTFDSRGRVEHFAIELAGVVRLSLDHLGFRARTGAKLDVTAEGLTLKFEGDLEFVNAIQRVIPASGFSDPPAISVMPEGISAGYTLAIPSLGIGVFSLENLALSAGLELPFIDRPVTFRFALSDRHDPFLVTVSLFGGGGFFALGVRAGRPAEVEAAIEFGGNASLDIVVASGGVHVLAGIYLKMSGSAVVLAGFLRAGGSLTVLGLVTISAEFVLSLTYTSAQGQFAAKVSGDASLTVSIEILFFSANVTLPVHREFKVGSGDPSFEDMIALEDWRTYCDAYAS